MYDIIDKTPSDWGQKQTDYAVEQFLVDIPDGEARKLPVIPPPQEGWEREWRCCRDCNAPLAIDNNTKGVFVQYKVCGHGVGMDIDQASYEIFGGHQYQYTLKWLMDLYEVSLDDVIYFITSRR